MSHAAAQSEFEGHRSLQISDFAVAPPRLHTPRICLRPIEPQDEAFLYWLWTNEEVGFRWRLRGTVPPRAAFAQFLWDDVLSQFLVQKPSGSPVGVVVAYGMDHHAGHCHFAVATSPQYLQTGYGMEAAILHLDYLFTTWPLRKIYVESFEYTAVSFRSAYRRIIRREGVLAEHSFYDGRYWDKYIGAIYRDDWMLQGRRWATRLRGSRD